MTVNLPPTARDQRWIEQDFDADSDPSSRAAVSIIALVSGDSLKHHPFFTERFCDQRQGTVHEAEGPFAPHLQSSGVRFLYTRFSLITPALARYGDPAAPSLALRRRACFPD
jgi:hypothetical protein